MRKTKSAAKSGIKPLIFGSLIIWCTFLVLSLIFSAILFSGDDPARSTALLSLTAFVLSGAVGTLINKKLFHCPDKSTPLFSVLLSALVYLALSAVISAKISLGAIISALCFMGASALVCIPKRKKLRRRHG